MEGIIFGDAFNFHKSFVVRCAHHDTRHHYSTCRTTTYLRAMSFVCVSCGGHVNPSAWRAYARMLRICLVDSSKDSASYERALPLIRQKKLIIASRSHVCYIICCCVKINCPPLGAIHPIGNGRMFRWICSELHRCMRNPHDNCKRRRRLHSTTKVCAHHGPIMCQSIVLSIL